MIWQRLIKSDPVPQSQKTMQRWLFDDFDKPANSSLEFKSDPKAELPVLQTFHRLFTDQYLHKAVFSILRGYAGPDGPSEMALWRAFVLGSAAADQMLGFEELADLINRSRVALEALGHQASEANEAYTASKIERLVQVLPDETIHALNNLVLEISLRQEEALLGLDDEPRPPLVSDELF